MLAGGISVQFGGALAVTLMPRTGALGVVTLRLAVAALVMLVVCRPRLRGHSRTDWGTVIVFGVTMAAMNGLFYQALARIPLGLAVTLEVLGPLALSVLASRRAVNVVWAGLALCGVFLLGGGGGFADLDPLGVAFALAAGLMWALYIVFSARTGRRFPQADGLALAMAVAAVLFLPLGIVESGPRLVDPTTIALGAAVAVLSSVLPYTLELLALRRLPASTFAVLMSLEPAIAATMRLPDPRPSPLRPRSPRDRAGHRGEHGGGADAGGAGEGGGFGVSAGRGAGTQNGTRARSQTADRQPVGSPTPDCA